MPGLNRKTLTGLALTCASVIIVFATLGIAAATGSSETPSKAYLHSYNLPSSGLALEGYCPVAYHVVGEPVRGKPEFTSIYNDVAYQFVSSEAKQYFDADPEKYLPAYGGWCAFGMAIQDKFPVDPTAFKIVDGRLMLFLRNRDVDALKLWEQNNEAQQVAKANAHWKKVSG